MLIQRWRVTSCIIIECVRTTNTARRLAGRRGALVRSRRLLLGVLVAVMVMARVWLARTTVNYTLIFLFF